MIGNFCPLYSCDEYNQNQLETHNLTQAITNNTQHTPSGTVSSYLMLSGEITNITFNIPYSGANKGSGQVNTYASPNNPSVSSDKISGPPGGGSTGSSVFRGMLIYTLTSSGSVGFPIYCNQDLSGSGVVSFSWLAQPGAYGGFMVELVNNNTVARSYYKHSFDVYSRLVSGNSNGPTLADSIASTSIYSSGGVYIGNLIITATEGPSMSTIGYCKTIPFGLTAVFYSPDNNVSSNEYKYGILNYNQYMNFTGTQAGSVNGTPVYEPCCASNQGTQSSVNGNNSAIQAAEQSLYDLAKTALLLTADPCLMAVGLAMVALGPVVFPGSAPSNTEKNYWNKPDHYNWISYGSWDLGNNNSNLPSASCIIVGYEGYGDSGLAVHAPVFPIVNDGNGNPSYLQYLSIMLKSQPENSLVTRQNQFTLNYFTYSTSMTIVPIAHCIAGFNLNENDYVNAASNGNGGYIYSGTSYTAAVTLPLYMPLEG